MKILGLALLASGAVTALPPPDVWPHVSEQSSARFKAVSSTFEGISHRAAWNSMILDARRAAETTR